MIPILDTHLHLLYQDNFAYDWCEELPALNQNFKVEGYQELIKGHEIAASIFMEVDVRESQISEEATFISELVNDSNNPLISVIAACRPEHEDFQQQLEFILTDSNSVCGLRRVLHNQSDELSKTSTFRKNLQSLPNHQMTFDLCVLERQLPLAYELVRACPDTQFILNHCGVPTINSDHFSQWKTDLQKLAELPNVICKVSGIIAYCASPEAATLETLKPWIETSVESFGSDRIVLGSDWPVCNLTKGLPTWLTMVREYFSTFSEDEQHSIFHRNAEKTYNLTLS